MEAGNAFLEDFRDRYNARFGRPPRDAEDVHRPLLAEQKIADIFQEQRSAKVSRSLTLHYKRTMYVLENCTENQAIACKQVQVFEDDEARVTIRFNGRCLRFTAFPKDGTHGVTPGDLVANKYLSGELTLIRSQQQEREAQQVQSRAIASKAGSFRSPS